jgi:hypothetical protein
MECDVLPNRMSGCAIAVQGHLGPELPYGIERFFLGYLRVLRGPPIAPTRLPAMGTFLVPWRTSRASGAGESFGVELESHVHRPVTLVVIVTRTAVLSMSSSQAGPISLIAIDKMYLRHLSPFDSLMAVIPVGALRLR